MTGQAQLAVRSTTQSVVSRSPWWLRAQSDRRLVELTRAGGKEAYETIVGRYRAPLLRYCRRLLGPDRAEDVVQDTFIRAYTALQGSTDEIRVRAWLYRIAHNAAVTELRDDDRRHGQLEDEEPHRAIVAGPQDQLERSEHLRSVVDSLKGLPAGQRHAIVLRELEGRSYDEIAAKLDTSRGSAHQLVRRARARLRAAAIMIIPPDLLARVPWAALREAPAPLTGLTAGGASALAKAGAAMLAAGAVAAGVSTGEGGGPGTPGREGGAPDAPSPGAVAAPSANGPSEAFLADGVPGETSGGRSDSSGFGGGRSDSSGFGGGRSGHDGGTSGHGDGTSGHGRSDSGHGSGSSDHDSSGSGSGLGLSAAGASEGSGSDSSGSGSSASSVEASDSSGPGSGSDGGDGAALGGDSSGESGSGKGGEGSG